MAVRQVRAAAVAEGDRVLEVGGGLGVLTRELAERGARVRVIEIEPSLAAHLEELGLPNVEVVCGDALEVDLGRPQKVVANIPYAIATPLIERLLDCGATVVVMMVQREVAKRLAAAPGSKAWSRLPAIVQREHGVEVLETVGPSAFFPQPKVHSAVVRLQRRPGAPARGAGAYRAVVGALFLDRRKKVRNTVLRAAAAVGAPAQGAVAAAERLGIADKRPEELTVAQFEALTRALGPAEND